PVLPSFPPRRSSDLHVFAIRDAAFQSSRAVRGTPEPSRRLFIKNLILHFAAEGARRRHPSADLHRLHRLHAHQRLRQPPIQFFVPLRVASHPHGNIVRSDFKNSAHRVARFTDSVNFRFHF